MARLSWTIGVAIFAMHFLFFPSATFAAWGECPECRQSCGYGPGADACMGVCLCDDFFPQPEPALAFGAIAHSFGDGYTSKSMRVQTSKEASDLALSHCQANSQTPDLCKLVTWYANSCGALAIGNTTYSSVGGGNNAPSLTRQQAEAAALTACRRDSRNTQCKLEASGCSDELTPQEKATNEELKQGIARTMGAGLCALWRDLPACSGLAAPTSQAPSNAESARLNRLISNAHAGDPKAQQQLGHAYHVGKGVQQDYAQAATWYRKAAGQGNVDAQTNLGVMYQQGQGVERDYTQAVAWYRSAAEKGSADAQANLGMLYHQGLGVALDYAQAAHWYRKAAEQGHVDARRKLDLLSNQGLVTKKKVTLSDIEFSANSMQ